MLYDAFRADPRSSFRRTVYRMKIGNVNQGKGVDATKRKGGASGSSGASFADRLRGAGASDEVAGAEPGIIDGHPAIEGVDALLAMQGVGDATDEKARRQAASYGEALLDRLNSLQDALLQGAIPKDMLMELAKKVRTGRIKVQDPRLNAILDDIELRVEVEIAKYTRGR